MIDFTSSTKQEFSAYINQRIEAGRKKKVKNTEHMILKCPKCGWAKIGYSNGNFYCRGCGYIWADLLNPPQKPVSIISPKFKESIFIHKTNYNNLALARSKNPIIKCSNCDWKTREEVIICENCGADL